LGKGLLQTAVSCWLLLSCGAAADPDESGLLGDVPDGNLSVPVHLISLYDANDLLVFPDANAPQPLSTRWSCGKCHDYSKISSGWHFNAARPDVPAGRLGEPWIYWDARTASQIPISYRPWPGTFRPEQIGLSPWWFTRTFGRHTPGGGVGEQDPNAAADPRQRWTISGNLEINCLACHSTDPAQDQAEYARQIARHNFHWAATASTGIGSVQGMSKDLPDFWAEWDRADSLPAVSYEKTHFNTNNQVLFDIVRKIPPQRCYFCHTTVPSGCEKWQRDPDVHLQAGLTCVDCHRNSLDHAIVRGYETEPVASSALRSATQSTSQPPLLASLTCKGCHIDNNSPLPLLAGRLGAPQPQHKGIPPEHFDKLTCTACHSGPWPGKTALFARTSMAHALGTDRASRFDETLPHIQLPVFARDSDGKIAPHKLLWPAFWGWLKNADIVPLAPDVVQELAGELLRHELELPASGTWPDLRPEEIVQILKRLQATDISKGQAVYVCGGKVNYVNDSGSLCQQDHPAARPYCWPFAHDVRPAVQALGVGGCTDCHTADAPFLFGKVPVDSALVSQKGSARTMVEFQQLDLLYTRLFAISFVFRPWLKLAALLSCVVLAGVLSLYALRGLACIAEAVGRKV
jgi:hypothetical protein